MPARRRSPSFDAGKSDPLASRIAELELRIKLLEAKVRELGAHAKPARKASAPRSSAPRARPRCPGCMLELPRGKRADACVWCGFLFAAVGGRAFK